MNLLKIKILLVLIITAVSCRTAVTKVTEIGLADNKYDSDFASNVNSSPLNRISNSVKMLNSIAYYESYLISYDNKITLKDLNGLDINSVAIKKVHSTETASGTATIIYSKNGRAALLTCSHIINFPDTLFSFHKIDSGSDTKYLESITIKIGQTNLLPELTVSSEVEIIAIDNEADIALIGCETNSTNSGDFLSINTQWGNSNELDWGTKVYILGYPLNNKMITSGLVSPPQISGKNYFFVDAVFNRGFSGGIVLAVRDGAPNFEIVGMVKSGTVHRKFNLVPDYNNPDFTYLPQIPYKDNLLVEEEKEMKYGVTKIMPVETIIDFLEINEGAINDYQLNTSRILNTK